MNQFKQNHRVMRVFGKYAAQNRSSRKKLKTSDRFGMMTLNAKHFSILTKMKSRVLYPPFSTKMTISMDNFGLFVHLCLQRVFYLQLPPDHVSRTRPFLVTNQNLFRTLRQLSSCIYFYDYFWTLWSCGHFYRLLLCLRIFCKLHFVLCYYHKLVR